MNIQKALNTLERDNKEIIKKCRWCGINFIPRLRKDQKDCSKICQKKFLYHKTDEKTFKSKFILEKECQYCGNKFKDDTFNNSQKFCSKKCVEHFSNKKCSEKEWDNKLSNLKCQYCGNTFKGIKQTQKFCSKKCSANNLYNKNKEHYREYSKNLRLKNIDRYRYLDKIQNEKHKDKRREYQKKRRSLKEYKIKQRLKDNKRYKEDILFNLKKKIRIRTREILKSKNIEKNYSFKDYIGCNPSQLKKHLEKLFTKGMTWNKLLNGEIHIDHIKPISLAKDQKEMLELNHYSNLQPLWAKDNISKSNRYK